MIADSSVPDPGDTGDVPAAVPVALEGLRVMADAEGVPMEGEVGFSEWREEVVRLRRRRKKRTRAMREVRAARPPIVPPAMAPEWEFFEAEGGGVEEEEEGVGMGRVAVRDAARKDVARYTERSFASGSQPPTGLFAVA